MRTIKLSHARRAGTNPMKNQNRESVEKIFEEVAMQGVAAVAPGSASSRDITEDEEYQKFVESMVPYCRCSRNQPCDGVLAGGLCDNIQEDNWESVFEDEDDC